MDAAIDISLLEMRQANDGLLFGNESAHLPGGVLKAYGLEELELRKPCSFWKEVTANDTAVLTACAGIQTVIEGYLTDAERLHSITNITLLTTDNSLFRELTYLYDTQLQTALRESVNLYYASANKHISVIESLLAAIFALSLPILLIAYASLRPLERRIQEENTRTMKMLLMIPMDVMDSVAALRDYLDSNEQQTAEKKLHDALEVSVARNRSIMEAAVDAIITINAQGVIELFNPAAVR